MVEVGEVLHLATRGSRYEIKVFCDGSDYYKAVSYTRGKERGAATGYNHSQMQDWIGKAIRSARIIDGITYRVISTSNRFVVENL